MAEIPFTMKQLDRARRQAGPPGTFDLDVRLRNIEAALLVVANALPNYEDGCNVWDELRNGEPMVEG